MSVAFTKEEDNEAAAAFLPERPISPHPNWVTARGLAELDAALAAAKEAVAAAQGNADLKNDRSAMARAMRDLRYFTARRASAELRETRGFISMTIIRPLSGLTANWMLDPPVSTPISRMIAKEASRIFWYSRSVRV